MWAMVLGNSVSRLQGRSIVAEGCGEARLLASWCPGSRGEGGLERVPSPPQAPSSGAPLPRRPCPSLHISRELVGG